MISMTFSRLSRACLLVLATTLGACATTAQRSVPDGTRARLAVLESTDLHSNILSYDYYRLAEDKALGFERMATLVAQARAEFPNTLLFDAGDTIQGTALADYQALVHPLGCDEELAMYRAMDALGYDGGTIGNHEFNYGLPFLAQVTGHPVDAEGAGAKKCAGPHFPLVLSNAVSVRNGGPLYPPYAVLERTLKLSDAHGRETTAPIRIGIIGFTPPPIVEWDRRNLDGKVTTLGVVEAATVDLVFLMLAGGALAGTVAALLGLGLVGQVLAAAVVAVALLGVVRPIAKKHLDGALPTKAIGTARYVGRIGVALEPIDEHTGLLEIGGETWTARIAEGDTPVPAQSEGRITAVRGATVIVTLASPVRDLPTRGE